MGSGRGSVGIALDPDFRNLTGATSSDYTGIAITYAGVAAHPVLHRNRTETRRTLVILDEVHHAGDAKSWGEAVREAFAPATRRLTLTGTPFRSDDDPIPFVSYEPDADGSLRSRADHFYGYADALADGVVRPVVFLAYSGQAELADERGEEFTARLGEPLTAEHTARAPRTALDPGGEWIPAVLAAADTRLSQLRSGRDAGRRRAGDRDRTRRPLAPTPSTLTHGKRLPPGGRAVRRAGCLRPDRPSSGAAEERWMVAVRMVSEGVDVPRLAVGAYATSAATPLFFAQAVGQFCSGPAGQGRRRACSCPACRPCSRLPVSSRRSVTTCSARRIVPRRAGTTRHSSRRRTGCSTSRARTRRRSLRWVPTPSSTR